MSNGLTNVLFPHPNFFYNIFIISNIEKHNFLQLLHQMIVYSGE